MRRAMGETKGFYEQKMCIAAYELIGFVGISVATALKLHQENELTVWAVPKTISDSRSSASVSPNKLDL